MYIPFLGQNAPLFCLAALISIYFKLIHLTVTLKILERYHKQRTEEEEEEEDSGFEEIAEKKCQP